MSKVLDVAGKKVEIIKDLSKNDAGAFVYLDPPYYPTAKTKDGKISPYKLYNGLDFVPIDFLKLKERCDELTKEGIPFILSNSNCEFIRFLFKEYILIDVDELRGLKGGTGKGSRPREMCLLITNFKEKKNFMNGINRMNKLMVKDGKPDN